MSRLRDYRSKVERLPGVRGREDMHDVIWFVLREFVAYYWDLPASQEHHHSGRWGLLRHSLEVAYKRAEKAAEQIAVDVEGNPSAEAGHKQRAERVFIAWLSGLFHDSGKICDIDLKYREGNKEIMYHPFRGNVLDYKLKHPEPGLVLQWAPGRGMMHAKRNLATFVFVFPRDLLQQLPQDQVNTLFDRLLEDGDTADQESVAEVREESDREYVQEAIKLFARDGYMAKDNKGRKQRRVFYLGDGIYALINPLVFQVLAGYIKQEIGKEGYKEEHVVNHLLNKNLVYSSKAEDGGGHYFLRLEGKINEHDVSFHVALAKGDLFADVDTSRLSSLRLKYDEEVEEKLKNILGFTPPTTWFLDHPSPSSEPSESQGNLDNSDDDPEIPFSEGEAESNTQETTLGENPGYTILKNLSRQLEAGEMTVNDPDNEKNVGFLSANDVLLWVMVSKFLCKAILDDTEGTSSKSFAIKSLQGVGCLVPFNNGEYYKNSYTRFETLQNELKATEKAQYIRLDINKVREVVPEISYSIKDNQS